MSEYLPQIVGILNVTPDSFSDGGQYHIPEVALAHAERMLRQGAAIIDVGGDSSRPGSQCVGPTEEWHRIEAVVTELAPKCAVSVDTHHASVAARALERGAQIVNDVSGGADPEMFAVVAQYRARYVLMHSRCPAPHVFPDPFPPTEDLVADIRRFFSERIERMLEAGVERERIILDPGLGAFSSREPRQSWEVIRRLKELEDFGLPILLGASRKGFLKQPDEEGIEERDILSALAALLAVQALAFQGPAYIRTHNVRWTRWALGAPLTEYRQIVVSKQVAK